MEATVLNAFVSLFFFDDDAVNVVGFRMLRTARFVVLNSVVKAWVFLDKDKDGARNDDSRMEDGDILVRGNLLVRVQYTRAMYYTRAGNTKRTHIKTRAHESSGALKIHP